MAMGAAVAFSVGGLLMKPADGLRALVPSALVFVLFAVGAACLAMLVRRGGDVGGAYVLVVGLEALLAFGLSALVFHEPVTTTRLLAVALVGAGTVLLAAPTG